jgi:hypothetical protein
LAHEKSNRRRDGSDGRRDAGPRRPGRRPTGGFNFGGWVAPLGEDPVFGAEIGKLFSEPFDLLLGRRTYEIFAGYWPYNEGGPHDYIAKTFNRITKYVATRKGVDLTWKGSVALCFPSAARQGQTAVQRRQLAARVQTHAQRRLAERAHRRDLRARWRGEDSHRRRRVLALGR